jgi:hypothetical protein
MESGPAAGWRRPLAGALLATAAAAFWLLSLDPKGLGGGAGLLGAAGVLATGVGALHLAAAACVAAGRRRAAGWLAILAGGWPLALTSLALALPGPAGREARDLAAFLLVMGGAVLALPVLALLLTQAALVDLGWRALRERPADFASRAWSVAFALIALSAAATGLRAWSGWLGSRDRRELVAAQRAGDARKSLLALARCLTRAAETDGGLPPALAQLPRGVDGCAGASFAPEAFPEHALRYVPGDPGADGRRRRFSLVLVPTSPGRRAFGAVRVDETGAAWEGVAEDGTGGAAYDDVARRIELVSLEIERSRLGSSAAAYPRSLAETGVLPGGTLARRVACGDCLLEAEIVSGRALGFRFLYAPGDAGYRLDVRPARFGEPFTRSYLCTPEGLLHYTDEDRAAEATDPVLWPNEHLRDPTTDLCVGRAEAEAILGRTAGR